MNKIIFNFRLKNRPEENSVFRILGLMWNIFLVGFFIYLLFTTIDKQLALFCFIFLLFILVIFMIASLRSKTITIDDSKIDIRYQFLPMRNKVIQFEDCVSYSFYLLRSYSRYLQYPSSTKETGIILKFKNHGDLKMYDLFDHRNVMALEQILKSKNILEIKK